MHAIRIALCAGFVVAVGGAAACASSSSGAGTSSTSSSSSSSGASGVSSSSGTSGASGSSSGTSGASGSSGTTVTCQNDPRVDTYVANLAKVSASGNLKVTLVSSDPAPPAVGTNTWSIHVADGAGASMSGAPITIASFMPDHGHGSSVRAVITPQADGNYSVTPVYLFMPGVWRVTFALPATDAAPVEQVQFFFCIAG